MLVLVLLGLGLAAIFFPIGLTLEEQLLFGLFAKSCFNLFWPVAVLKDLFWWHLCSSFWEIVLQWSLMKVFNLCRILGLQLAT